MPVINLNKAIIFTKHDNISALAIITMLLP